MTIRIVTPAAKGSRQGNRVTALRWARVLRALGHRVTVTSDERPGTEEVLVALHARKSAAAVAAFRAAHPTRPVVVALTGTDLYHDLPRSATARRTLEEATRIVVLQGLAWRSLPTHLARRTRVIHQSVVAPARRTTTATARADGRPFDVIVMGHLRAVKDPLRVALAARHLPPESRLRVLQVGGSLDPALATRARAEEERNPRYRWLGELPRAQALRLLARCRLLVLPSRLEGGANVIGEAITLGVPVLASHIDGSVGLLGPRYPGYFEVGDTDRLAVLLARAERDPRFYRRLAGLCERRRPLFDPARERAAWSALLAELRPGPAR